MTAPVRHATVTARIAGQTRTVDQVTWSHGVAHNGDVGGLDGTLTLAPTGPDPAHPTVGDTTTLGASVRVDWTDTDGTVRLVTGRVDTTEGSTVDDVQQARLTDWLSRLETPVELRPAAWSAARNRHTALFGVWFTEQAMRLAGFPPTLTAGKWTLWHQSMCGSTTPIPDPDSTYGALGDLTHSYRSTGYGQSDTNTAPQVAQGDHAPCMEGVYTLGWTADRPSTTTLNRAWRLTVDLAVTAPVTGDYGRVRLSGPSGSLVGSALELEWTQTTVKVSRYNNETGATAQVAILARAGQARWCLIYEPATGEVSLTSEDGRTTTGTITDAIGLTTGRHRASVRVESPGRIGAVSVARARYPSVVTRPRLGRIYRSDLWALSMPAYDFVPSTPAGRLLTDQADAERGWRGMPLWQWIDHDGVLNNVDFAWLAHRPVAHRLATTGAGTAVDSSQWRVSRDGPYRSVTVRSRWSRVTHRAEPTLLLAEGPRETLQHGDTLDQILHPAPDTTWLDIDARPRLAGHAYGAGGYPRAWKDDLERARGTWVGGSRVDATDANGDLVRDARGGWMTPERFPDWTLHSSGYVLGALSVLDPRTVLVSGRVSPGGQMHAGQWVYFDYSSMPDLLSQGLPEHRKDQPLTQLRGQAIARWFDQTSTTDTTTGETAEWLPGYEHDCGMWVQQRSGREAMASEIAAGLDDPPPTWTVRAAMDPRIRVGDVVECSETVAGRRLAYRGVVASVAGRLPGDELVLDVVVVSQTWAGLDGPVPVPPDPPGDAPARPITPDPITIPDPIVATETPIEE